MHESVDYEVHAGIATITMNRPSNRNALAAELVNAVGDGLIAGRDDDTVRAIVLTNAGTTFCAGADLKGTSQEAPRYDLVQLFRLMQDNPKPVIGRIAGHCTGGGVGLAAACDISLVADDALLGFTEVRLGVSAAMISVVCVPKMRHGDAMELLLSGEKISAARAAEVGLVNRAVPRDELDSALDDLLAKVVRGGPNALSASKQLVSRVPSMTKDDAYAWTQPLSAELFLSDEAAAGIAAFREKRDAPWVPGAST
ncbi:MAG: methylglutaconyl-CoA hydratase [Glaciecola sp.]|jgi:methylglutaconyl-CoA hydratase